MKKKGDDYGIQRERAEMKRLLARLPRAEKRPVTTAQATSTQASFDSPEPLSTRPWPPVGWNPKPDAENIHERVAPRVVSVDEVTMFESNRRAAKNNAGQSEESSISDEAKRKAADAFRYSPPAPPQEVATSKITGLVPILSQRPTQLAEEQRRTIKATMDLRASPLKKRWHDKLLSAVSEPIGRAVGLVFPWLKRGDE